MIQLCPTDVSRSNICSKSPVWGCKKEKDSPCSGEPLAEERRQILLEVTNSAVGVEMRAGSQPLLGYQKSYREWAAGDRCRRSPVNGREHAQKIIRLFIGACSTHKRSNRREMSG